MTPNIVNNLQGVQRRMVFGKFSRIFKIFFVFVVVIFDLAQVWRLYFALCANSINKSFCEK